MRTAILDRDPVATPFAPAEVARAPRVLDPTSALPHDPDATWTAAEAAAWEKFMEEVRAYHRDHVEMSWVPLEAPDYPPRTPEQLEQYELYYHHHPEESVSRHYSEDQNCGYVQRVIELRRPFGCVFNDLPCYPHPGRNTLYLVPDVGVCDAPGIHDGQRSYRKWEHGALRFVMEVASNDSRARDRGPKRQEYGALFGPDEYLYYDPAQHVLKLYCGWDGVRYYEAPPDARGWVWSEVTQVYFAHDPERPMRLRLYDRDGTPQRTYEEAEAAVRTETARAEHEAARAAEAEARVASLLAELAQLKNVSPS